MLCDGGCPLSLSGPLLRLTCPGGATLESDALRFLGAAGPWGSRPGGVGGPWGGRREELEAVSGRPQEGHLGHSCCRSRRLPRQPPALSPLAPGQPHTGTEIASF